MQKFKPGDRVRINGVDGLTAEGIVKYYYSGDRASCSVTVTRIIHTTKQCIDRYGYVLNVGRDLSWGCPIEDLTPLNLSYKRIFIQKVTDNAKHR